MAQTREQNEITWHLLEKLDHLGLKPVFHDISVSFPDTRELPGIILSWFKSPSMTHPEKYLEWLESLIYQQVKVIIFGNMGAYQNKENKAWLESHKIRKFFQALGLTLPGRMDQ